MSDTARIEQDIQAARARLEGTVNELAYRAQPQVIAQRQLQGLRLRLDAATHTEDGELRWRKVLRADPAFAPAPAEVARLRRTVRFELMLVAVIFVLAAAMARYGGF